MNTEAAAGPYKPAPFNPLRGQSNPHVQSILGNFLKPRGAALTRQLVSTPDGDQLAVDFPPRVTAPRGVVLVLHGLEGSSHSGTVLELFRQLQKHALQGVGMNFRTCGGVQSQTGRMYHAGETSDLAFLLEWLQARFPGLPVGAAGFSLGANILLKYLGTTGADAGVEAAAAISPPFDLTRSTNAISTGFSQIYSRGFLKKLKRKAARLALHHDSRIDLERVRAARTLNDFDNAVIAPLFGFRDADDYYAQSSSGRYLADIRRPTFILRALDDPFFDPDDIPLAVIAANPYLSAEFPPHGGHVGFVEGRKSFWAEKETARFFAHEFSEDKHGQGSR